MNGTGPHLIEKILFQTILLLIGRIFLENDELNADNSTKIYLDKINIFLDTYAPLKRINKYKIKLKSKPWITLDL